MYNAFSFHDLYDWELSVWLGLAMLFSSQLWGVTLPIALIIEMIIISIDFYVIIEALIYMSDVQPGHPQEHEFSTLNFLIGPVRRALVDFFVLSAMIFMSIILLYVFVMTWVVIVDQYVY